MESPPPFWQWTGLWVSIAALGLGLFALPTALQMFFGRPKIRLEFNTAVVKRSKVLRCYVINEYITNEFFRFVGVTRDPMVIAIGFGVVRAGSNEEVVNIVRPLINVETGKPQLRVRLSGRLPAIFAVASIDEEGKAAIMNRDEDEGGHIDIPQGRYIVKISVVGPEWTKKFCGEFTIGRTQEQSYWLA